MMCKKRLSFFQKTAICGLLACLLFSACTPTDDPHPTATPAEIITSTPTSTVIPTETPILTPTPEETPFPTPDNWHLQPHEGTAIRYEGFGALADTVIVIDPGHQAAAMDSYEPIGPGATEQKRQVTAGTVGVASHLRESRLNLRVALILREMLVAKGYTVILTRETEDVQISNRERAEIANQAGAALLVHIHANGAENADADGALTICQTPKNPYNAALYAESRRASECILAAFCAQTGIRQRTVSETDTMSGINWANVPATILEMGFMTNSQEDLLLASESFSVQAAAGILNGIEQFLQK